VRTSIYLNPRADGSLQESRHVQQIQLKISPVQTNYAPDGRSLLYTSAGHQLFFLTYGKDNDSSKDVWRISDKDGVSDILPFSVFIPQHDRQTIVASTAMFNHVGDGIILTHHSEHNLRIMDYPSLTLRESPAAHVGGCVAVALDPRGRLIQSRLLCKQETEPWPTGTSLLAGTTRSSTCLT